jgi:hypothetical protein
MISSASLSSKFQDAHLASIYRLASILMYAHHVPVVRVKRLFSVSKILRDSTLARDGQA